MKRYLNVKKKVSTEAYRQDVKVPFDIPAHDPIFPCWR